MSSLAPSIIAGSVAMASTVLSFVIAITTMRRSHVDSMESRSQQIALSLMSRRLDAIELSWQYLFKLQSGKALSDREVDQLVGSTMWLPASLRDSLLQMITGKSDTPQAFASLRKELLNASGMSEIDMTLKRLNHLEKG